MGKRRRGRQRRQDKAEGRTVPKCARLLIGARPSARMDAVQVSRAGAVRGPWPDAAKPALGRARDGSRHRTGAGTVIHDQTNQHLIPVVANALLLSVITA